MRKIMGGFSIVLALAIGNLTYVHRLSVSRKSSSNWQMGRPCR